MQQLSLPQYQFKIKEEGGIKYIFDPIRKKYLVLQPEEWVRQNFIQFLIKEKGFPSSLIAVEKGLKLGASDYMIKAHFTPDEIVDKIQKILKESYI